MVSLHSIKIGVAKFLEEEVLSVLPPWQKVLFGTASALIIRNADNIMKTAIEMPLVKAMDIVQPDGSVDIQKVYSELHAQAERTPFTVDIPVIGSVKFNAADVEKLYKLILDS